MDSAVTQPGGPAGPAALRPGFVRFPMYLRAICSGFPTQIAADREAHHLGPLAGTEKIITVIFAKPQYLISMDPRTRPLVRNWSSTYRMTTYMYPYL